MDKIVQMLRDAQAELDTKSDELLDARLALQSAQKDFDRAFTGYTLATSKVSILVTQLATEAK